MVSQQKNYHYKTIFISDLHLGTKDSRADLLLHFLKSVKCEHLYLVGDIVDGWRLASSWHWPDEHQDIIDYILQKAQSGLKITLLPGNHDDFLRQSRYAQYIPSCLEFGEDFVFKATNKKRYLVLHGDQVDEIVRNAKWLAKLGDWAYHIAIFFNRGLNLIRKALGLKYWSLSLQLKQYVKKIATRNRFEKSLTQIAKEKGLDGVICGHSHRPMISIYENIEYMNDGDWVESLSALVEHFDGRFEIIKWDFELGIERHQLELMRRKGITPHLPQWGENCT